MRLSNIIGNFGLKLPAQGNLVTKTLTGDSLNTCKPGKNNDFKQKIQTLMVQSLDNAFIGHSFNRTVEREYFQHLEAYLRLIEPIIQDLKVKGFIK